MQELDKISSLLFDKIRGKFAGVSLGDESGKAVTDPEKARFFNFDFVVDGKNFGNITISLVNGTSVKVYFNKEIAEKLSKEEQDIWYNFLKDIRRFAKSNILTFDTRDISRNALDIRDIMQQSNSTGAYASDEIKIQESKMYGTRTKSYDRVGETRLIVRHNTVVDEEKRGARTRNIESIFVENSEGERFKLPFVNLHGARAIGQHVAHGGTLTDDRSQQIISMVEEVQQLGRFLRATRNTDTFEDTEVPRMVEAARDRYFEVRGNLKSMRGPKGYARFWENYIAREQANADNSDLRERFTKKFLDQRIEEALPFVYAAYEDRQSRLDSRSNLALEFEAWAEKMVSGAEVVTEGTWAIPDVEGVNRFKKLMEKPLELGTDGDNATSALYDIFGDDELFDQLYDASQQHGPEVDARPIIVKWFIGFYKKAGTSYKELNDVANFLRNWKPKAEEPAQPAEPAPTESIEEAKLPVTDEDPLVTNYDDEFEPGEPGIAGHMNLSVWMNIHSIPSEYQEELANMVHDAGEEEKVEVPAEMKREYDANYEKEGKPTRKLWIALSQHHASEVQGQDDSDDNAVDFADLKKLAGL